MAEITSEFEIYKLSATLEIWEIAILLLGLNPSSISTRESDRYGVETYFSDIPEEIDGQFQALKKVLIAAIREEEIKNCFDNQPSDFTSVEVQALKNWIKSKGFKCSFFDISNTENQPYLDRDHPHYSPKLHAAIKSWMEFKDAEIEGTSPKETLKVWLSGHAVELDLIHGGNPNKSAIEEVAKIANWETKGGAPKTPTKKFSSDDKEKDENDISDLPF